MNTLIYVINITRHHYHQKRNLAEKINIHKEYTDNIEITLRV